MAAPNAHASESTTGANGKAPERFASPFDTPNVLAGSQYSHEQMKEFCAALEVPFHPRVIAWRVTNTSKNGKARGQVIPYADQRAYTDRLNALFTPGGWTRKYSVHTSANFECSKDQKTVAKVFVICVLTIFGIGSHSATGEEWADDENAGTSAEAQSFKRACACFGLGRYLYHFEGTWVDLDDRKRPKSVPQLPKWATPDGWRQGLRPNLDGLGTSDKPAPASAASGSPAVRTRSADHGNNAALVRQIEGMAETLGKGMYRGLLKTIARAWTPDQIEDTALLERVFAHMQAAERGLRRLAAAVASVGPDALQSVLRSLNLRSLDNVDGLETLKMIVIAVEQAADKTEH